MAMRTITFTDIKEPHTYSKNRDTFDSDIVKVDADICGFNESGCTVTIENKMYFYKLSGKSMHTNGDSKKLAIMYNIVPDIENLDTKYTIMIRIWKETNEMKVTYIKSSKDMPDISKITCNIDVK